MMPSGTLKGKREETRDEKRVRLTQGGSGVFRSAQTRLSDPTPLSDVVSVFTYTYSGADNYPEEVRAALAAAIIREFNDSGKMNDKVTMSYILTVLGLIFPDTYEKLMKSNAGSFKTTEVNINIIPIIKHLEHIFSDDDDEDEGDTAAAESSAAGGQGTVSRSKVLMSDLNLGICTVSVHSENVGAPLEVVAGRWAIEMFPIGKNVSLENMDGFRVNRVRALVGSRNWDASIENAYFKGSMTPTFPILKSVETSFNTFLAIRSKLANEWIDWIQSANTTSKMTFASVIRLTDGYGLGGASMILDLLSAYPIIYQFPDLKPAAEKFMTALEEFEGETGSKRGFVKVLYGPKYTLFSNSTKGALLRVAVLYAQQTNPTMSRFLSDVSHSDETFRRLNKFLIANDELPISGDSNAGKTGASV